jgi:hypothetical protein
MASGDAATMTHGKASWLVNIAHIAKVNEAADHDRGPS